MTATATEAAPPHAVQRGSALEVLRIFLKLGLICFGGPVAHIGCFRDEFVVRRKWPDWKEERPGLCPGPRWA
jgi:chromate transporter